MFTADNHIKSMWDIFKNKKIENQYLFYIEKNHLKNIKISMNETNHYGEVNIKKLKNLSKTLKGKNVIAVHNHPKEKPLPSDSDYFQMEHLDSLLALIDVHLQDYVIVSPYGFFSFKENNLLKNPEKYKVNFESYIEQISLPKIILSKDVKKNELKLKKVLKEYSEILYNNKYKYASNFFTGEFLLDISDDISMKNILFFNKDSINYSLKRIKDINNVLEPFEIYMLENDTLNPLKKNGVL